MSKIKVLFLTNSDEGFLGFRKEVVEEMLTPGVYIDGREGECHDVYVGVPFGESIRELEKIGCKCIDISFDRHGKNPFSDIILCINYLKIVKTLKPDIVFTYTIKPNIYGNIACGILRIPCVANITGLGTAVENKGLMQWVTVLLYRIAFRKVRTIFFQNVENRNFFRKRNIAIDRQNLIPGSGVNLNRFSFLSYPNEDTIEFAFISRIMKEKGIEEYLEAAKYICSKYGNVKFHVCGTYEKEYRGKLQECIDKKFVIYHGNVKDIREIHRYTHCTVHPSFYPEGLSNVLLEACACGRPIITTNRSGCREVVEDGVNGMIVKEKNSTDLIEKLEMFIKYPYEKKKEMGMASRKKVEACFDRKCVVEAYLKEVDLCEKNK